MDIVGIHGYNVTDNGAGSVDRFGPYLEQCGHKYWSELADYGWQGLLSTRFGSIERTARRLALLLDEIDLKDVVLLAHSNGLAVAHEAVYYTNRVDTIIAFNGALDPDARFSCLVSQVINFYCPADKVLKYGASLRPWHKWGRAGQVGLISRDPRITNIRMDDVHGHSDVFQASDLCAKYAGIVCDLLDGR